MVRRAEHEGSTNGRDTWRALQKEQFTFPVRTSVVRTLQPLDEVSRLVVVAGGEMGAIPTVDQLAQTVRGLVQGETHMALVSTSALEGAPAEMHEASALALARSMGTILPADDKGTELIRIYDTGDRRSLAEGGLYRHSRTPGKPHTDNICLPYDIDCLMLLCVRPALEGGESVLVNAKKVRETLEHENPRAARLLASPSWLFSTKGMGEERVFEKALLTEDGRAHFMGDYLRRAHEDLSDGAPMTGEQELAVNVLEDVLKRPALQTRIPLKSGDILMTEDSRYFHSREPWYDDPNVPPGEARRLARIWVAFDKVPKVSSKTNG